MLQVYVVSATLPFLLLLKLYNWSLRDDVDVCACVYVWKPHMQVYNDRFCICKEIFLLTCLQITHRQRTERSLYFKFWMYVNSCHVFIFTAVFLFCFGYLVPVEYAAGHVHSCQRRCSDLCCKWFHQVASQDILFMMKTG